MHCRVAGLAYADDLSGVAGSMAGLQRIVDICHRHSQDWLWEANTRKSRTMICNSHPDAQPAPCLWGTAQLPDTEEEKYLGVWLTQDQSMTKHLRSVLSKGAAVLYAVRPLLHSSKLCLSVKLDILRSHVLPVMTYACESWTASSKPELALVAKIDTLLMTALKTALTPSFCKRHVTGTGLYKWEYMRAVKLQVAKHDCSMPSFSDEQDSAKLRMFYRLLNATPPQPGISVETHAMLAKQNRDPWRKRVALLLADLFPDTAGQFRWGHVPQQPVPCPTNAEIALRVQRRSWRTLVHHSGDTTQTGDTLPAVPLHRTRRSVRIRQHQSGGSHPRGEGCENMFGYVLNKLRPEVGAENGTRLLYTTLPVEVAGAIAALRSGHLLGDTTSLDELDFCSKCQQHFAQRVPRCTHASMLWLRVVHSLMHCPGTMHGVAEFLQEWGALAKGALGDDYMARMRPLWEQLQVTHDITAETLPVWMEFLKFLTAPDRHFAPPHSIRLRLLAIVGRLVVPPELVCVHHADADYLGADEPVAIPAGLSEEARAVFARAPSVGDRRVADALRVGRDSR
jgi:hypothetical protein